MERTQKGALADLHRLKHYHVTEEHTDQWVEIKREADSN